VPVTPAPSASVSLLVPLPAPLVPVEVDPETPAPVAPFRFPAAVLPSLLGLPLRLVVVELLAPEAAGDADAFDSIQPELRASMPCIRHPVIVTRGAAFVDRGDGVARSVPVCCDVSRDPLLVDGDFFWSSEVCG
jgi:hypothetical protein